MFTNVVHLAGRIAKPASVILLAVTVGNPTNAQAAVGRYESTGALGDLMPVGETVVFNTGGALPTVQIGTSASLTGRLQDDIAIYDFDSIVLPATVTVEITGPRPLVIAAAKDFFSAATFDVSGGRAGGGAGGSQGKSEASGGYGLLGAGYTSGVDGGLGGQGGYIYCDQTLGRYGMVGKSGYSGWKGSPGQSGSAGASGSSGFGFNYTIAGGSAGPGGSSGTAGRGGWGGAGGAPGDCNPLDGSGKAGGNGGVGGDGDPGGNGQNGGAGAAGYFYFPADTLDLVAGCGGGAGGGGGGGAGGSSGGSGGSGGGGGGGNGELWPGNRDGGHGAWSSRSGSGGESGDGGIGGLGGYGASGGGAIVLSARGLLKLGPTSVINVSASEPGLPTNGVPGTSGQSGDYGVGIQYSSPHYNRGGNSGAGGDGGRGGDGGTGGNGGPGGTGTAGMVKLQGSVIVTDGVIDATNYTDDTTPGVAAKITFISNLINNSVNSQNLSYVDTVVTGTVRNNEVLTTTSAYSNAIKVALMPTLDSGPSAAGFCMDDYFQEDKVVAQLLTQPPGVDLELIRLGGVFEGTDQVFLVNRSGGTLADRFLNINGHALEVPPVAPGKVWVVAVRSTDEAHLVGESGIGDFAIY